MTACIISAIVAVSASGVIGEAGTMPWHVPADLRWFKGMTKGKALIMGRKTFESLPGPLPGRFIIVLSHKDGAHTDNVVYAKDTHTALRAAKRHTAANEQAGNEIMIAGGAQVYSAFRTCMQRLYVTQIARFYTGDTVFPFALPALLQSQLLEWVPAKKWDIPSCAIRRYDLA